MKSSITILFLINILNINLLAQLSAPTTEAVYGGRINAIAAYDNGSTSRVFISTESANSIFYSDVTPTSGSESFGAFTVLPDAGDDDGYGSGISIMQTHTLSGYLFFISSGKLYKSNTSASSLSGVLYSGQVSTVLIYGNNIFYINGNKLIFGVLDASAAFTSRDSLNMGGAPANPVICVNPSNNKLYITSVQTASPSVYKSADNYNALTNSSSFGSLTLGTMSTVNQWKAFGIGPDGTLFFGGDNGSTKYIDYSTNDGTNWSGGSTSKNGVAGPNFGFTSTTPTYSLFFTKIYATFNASTGFGAWNEFGTSGQETHPNDGAVCVDPNNEQIIYMTTDQGIGATKNGGPNIFEIDDGVEAVQVNDFDMNSSKTTGWLASKAGIRQVTNYTTTPSWTNAIFPNGDGSPYYSAEMELNNTSTAYVGNLRVYKTTDSGSNWTQVLSGDSKGYPSFGTQVQAIEVCPSNSNLVTAGFVIDQSTDQGGFWYSTDAGSTWAQKLLRAASGINDADVCDIVFNSESGTTYVYIGVYYDLGIAAPADRARSIYRMEWTGSAWTNLRNDFDASYTSTSTTLTASIYDLTVSSTGDTLIACGTDAGTNHPVVYMKIISGTNLWTPLPTSGFPTGGTGKAVALGNGVVYVAVENVVYTLAPGASSWVTGYSYPAGTQINVLYFDDLLVGTGTGLYGQDFTGPLPVTLTSFTAAIRENEVELNWHTETEVNNYGFDVERAWSTTTPIQGRQEIDWEVIGFVPGHGNSNSPNDYTYIDSNPPAGKITYRLKQIDTDGSYEYYGTVTELDFGITGGLESIMQPTEYALMQNYPNPFNPTTTIKYNIPAVKTLHATSLQHISLKVYDTLGRELATLVNEQQSPGYYQVQFDGSKLASGVYLYKLEVGSFISVKKLTLIK